MNSMPSVLSGASLDNSAADRATTDTSWTFDTVLPTLGIGVSLLATLVWDGAVVWAILRLLLG